MAFSVDVLEMFKPVVDVLAALQQWPNRLVDSPLLASSIERVKSFFELVRRKVYLSGESHAKEYVIADQMALFLDTVLVESSTGFNKFASKNEGVLLVRCYSIGGNEGEFTNQGDRLFEVSTGINYAQLQQTVDQKFFTAGTIIQYIGEEDQQVVIDSDLVLRKATQKAIRDSYYENEKEVTLRLLVLPPPK